MKGTKLFITGTDTGVGKTVVATALLEAARQHGLEAIGIKPVAAGCERGQRGLMNADALELLAASSSDLDYRQVNPVALEPAIAPHIAAQQAGIALDVGTLANHCREMEAVDWTIIEGAGGWLVPLNDSETMADLCVTLNATAILVVGMRLGCINHALLSLAAIKSSGVKLAGWFGNCLEPEMSALQENLATLRDRIDMPCLGTIPHLDPCNGKIAAQHIDLQLLLDATQ